jgi:protein O-mannosyl-transferase
VRFFLIFAIPAALFLYSPALQAPLYWDDENTVRDSDTWQTVTLAGSINPNSRTLTRLSLWANHRLADVFSQTFPWREPFYFRIVSVLMHSLSATLVVGLMVELCGQWVPAVLAGTLFLVHPIQSEAVIYIAQRAEVQAALFMIAATLCYVQFRRRPSKRLLLCLAVLCYAAIASKESALIILPWLGLIELIFFFHKRDVKWLIYVVPAVFAAALFGLNTFLSRGISRTFTSWPDYLLSKGIVLETYLRLIVFPREQFLLYDLPTVTRASAAVAAQWALPLGLLVLGIVLLRKRPLAGFGLLSFFILLLPDILIPRGDLMFEYRVYPAFAGIAVAVAAVPRTMHKIGIGLFVLLALVLGYRTIERSKEWTDPLHFFETNRDRFPTDPKILMSLEAQYEKHGMFNKALVITQEARRYEGRLNDYYHNHVASVIATTLGFQYLLVRNIESARVEAKRAITLNGEYSLSLFLMGAVQRASGEYSQARKTYMQLLKLEPTNASAWGLLGDTLRKTGAFDLAQIAENRARKQSEGAEEHKPARLIIPKKYARFVVFGSAMLLLTVVFLAFRMVWPAVYPLFHGDNRNLAFSDWKM